MRIALLIVLFLGFVGAMYQKKVNSIIGLPILALAIAVIAGVPFPDLLNQVISDGALRLHTPIIIIIFGATLAEIVKRSGMVEVLIKSTAEYLGDRVFWISVFLFLVISVLFSVLAGLGAIVMVGTVVLPVMLSLGLSKALAACIFLMGISLGGMLNLFNWSLFIEVLQLSKAEILHYVVRFLPVVILGSVLLIWVEIKRMGGSSFKLRLQEPSEQKKIPIWTFFTPVLPVVLLMGTTMARLPLPIIAAMMIGIIYGVISTPAHVGPKAKLLTRSMFDGIAGVAPAIALMIGIGMLLKSVAHPQVAALLNPIMKEFLPTTAGGYFLFFTLLAPLALYRGPLNLWGMGSGLVAIMNDSKAIPAAAIMAALMAVGHIQGVSDPTNTHNVWVANYLGIDVVKILKKTILYTWGMALIGLGLAAAMYYG